MSPLVAAALVAVGVVHIFALSLCGAAKATPPIQPRDKANLETDLPRNDG